MSTIREQAREAARAARPYEPGFYDTPSRPLISAEDSAKMSDAASDVWEAATATARLREAGIDLERLTRVLESKDNWSHLVNAFEVLTVLGAVKAEMEALTLPE